jgi:hypothetical protein
MITLFIINSIVMFAAGWLFACRFYDKRLNEKTLLMNKAKDALANSTALNSALTASLDAATQIIKKFRENEAIVR